MSSRLAVRYNRATMPPAAQRFRLTLVPGPPVEPTPYITLRPEPGIRVRLDRRRQT